MIKNFIKYKRSNSSVTLYFLDDMIFNIQSQFNLLINATYLDVQSFLFIIKLDKFKRIHCT